MSPTTRPSLTVNETALYLGVSRQTVHRLLATGALSATERNPRDRRQRLIPRRQVERLASRYPPAPKLGEPRTP
jgi:excisionase family DNA binding protein